MRITSVDVRYRFTPDAYGGGERGTFGKVESAHEDGGTIIWPEEDLTDAQIQQIGYVILHRDRDGLPLPVEPCPRTFILSGYSLLGFLMGVGLMWSVT